MDQSALRVRGGSQEELVSVTRARQVQLTSGGTKAEEEEDNMDTGGKHTLAPPNKKKREKLRLEGTGSGQNRYGGNRKHRRRHMKKRKTV